MELFHLDVKDHVEFDKLESMWNLPAILQSIKCNSDILHFLGNGIRSDGRAGATANGQCVIYQLWQGRPYLCIFFGYLTLQCFTSKMLASLFLRTFNTHQLKPVSSAAHICTANSATWTGWERLRSDNFSQEPRRWSSLSICSK